MPESFDPYYEWLGIPPKDQPPHLYRLLGIEAFESNPSVIEHAADRLMAHLRTFQTGKHGKASQALLNEISRAKVRLLNEDKKSAYDAELHARLNHSQPAAPAAPAAPALPMSAPPQLNPIVETPVQSVPVVSSRVPGTPPVVAQPQAVTATAGTRDAGDSKPIWANPVLLAGAGAGAFALLVGLLFFVFGRGADPAPPVIPGVEPPIVEVPKEQPLAGLIGAENEIPKLAWRNASQSTVAAIQAADGMLHPDFAFCQSLPLADLEQTARSLTPSGYRIHRLRPYTSDGKDLVAVVWHRDGRAWRMASGRSADELLKANEQLKDKGFIPTDVATYDSGKVGMAVWTRPKPGEGDAEMSVQLRGDSSQATYQKMKAGGFEPYTIQICRDEAGEVVQSHIWKKSRAPHFLLKGGGLKTLQAEIEKPRLLQDVTTFRAVDKPELSFAATLDTKSRRMNAELLALTTSEQVSRAGQLASLGLRPQAIAVFQEKGASQAVSSLVWRLPPGVRPLSELLAWDRQRREPKPDIQQVVLLEKNAHVQVANTRGIATQRTSFTAELWMKLAPPPDERTIVRHAIMGTASGMNTFDEPPKTGWLLCSEVVPDAKEEAISLVWAGEKDRQTVKLAPPAGAWRHIAVCNDVKPGVSRRSSVFVDGKMVLTTTEPYTASPPVSVNNVFVGVSATNNPGLSLLAALRGFRLSRKVLYSGGFTPDAILTSSRDTASLLDFSQGTGTLLADASGNRRDGSLSDAKWQQVDASLPTYVGEVVPSVVVTPDPPKPPLPPKKKPAPPDASAVAAKVKEIRDVFKEEYAAATTPAARLSLADMLQKQAEGDSNDVARFALLSEAAEKAAEGGNLTQSLQTIDELASEFELETWKKRLKLLDVAIKGSRTPIERASLAQIAVDLGDKANGENEFATAIRLYTTGQKEANRGKDKVLARATLKKLTQARDAQRLYSLAESARVKLESSPDDADANLTWGAFQCFLRGEWTEGLGRLTKGSNATLADLAKRDVAGPSTPKELVALADAWKDYGDNNGGPSQNGAWIRAMHWYKEAVPKLTSITKTRVERTFDTLASKTTPINGKSAVGLLDWLGDKEGLVKSYSGHSSEVSCLAVGGSGRYVASGSHDGTIRVLDLQEGKLLHELKPNVTSTVRMEGVAISPDDKYVIGGGRNEKGLGVWELKSGKQVRGINTNDYIAKVAMSRDGRKLAWATPSSGRPNVGVFNLSQNRLNGVLQTKSYVSGLDLAQDGSLLATLDGSRNLSVWNFSSGRAIPKFEVNTGSASVSDIAFSNDARRLAVATRESIQIRDARDGKLATELKSDDRSLSPRSVRFSPKNDQILVAGSYGQLELWDIEAGARVKVIAGSQGRRRISSGPTFSVVRYLPDPRGVVVGDQRGGVHVYRLPDPE